MCCVLQKVFSFTGSLTLRASRFGNASCVTDVWNPIESRQFIGWWPLTSSAYIGECAIYSSDFSAFTKRSYCPSVLRFFWPKYHIRMRFISDDLSVIQRHRRFLRFAFGGKAYQYKVLPFGLALAPRTFTKCMDAALALLRLQGIRVLNYLDDWLILAHSRELVSRHRDIVLRHIHSLGLNMNAKKSVLLPSQRTVFLGVH